MFWGLRATSQHGENIHWEKPSPCVGLLGGWSLVPSPLHPHPHLGRHSGSCLASAQLQGGAGLSSPGLSSPLCRAWSGDLFFAGCFCELQNSLPKIHREGFWEERKGCRMTCPHSILTPKCGFCCSPASPDICVWLPYADLRATWLFLST